MSDLGSPDAVMLPRGNVLLTCVTVGKVGSLPPVAVARAGALWKAAAVACKDTVLTSGWSCLLVSDS